MSDGCVTVGAMATAAQLRKTASSHPGTVEDGEGGERTWTVDGVRFAALDAPAHLLLRLPEAEAADLLGRYPSAATAEGCVRVPIGDIDARALHHWVRRAWLATAPAAAANVAAGDVGDLPKAIGRPAARALADAGITTLDHVAAVTDAELAALHGVGPKAVRILRETLDRR
jgi:predicted flap endonuclease-1-like 5' DNA nuclease